MIFHSPLRFMFTKWRRPMRTEADLAAECQRLARKAYTLREACLDGLVDTGRLAAFALELRACVKAVRRVGR